MATYKFSVTISLDDDAQTSASSLRDIIAAAVLDAVPDVGTNPPTIDVTCNNASDANTAFKPPGVVGILTDRDGQVLVNCTDFDVSGYGGFSLRESQELRAKRELAKLFISAYCAPIVADLIDNHRAEEMVERAIKRHGCKVTLIPINHPA